jgi:hypothetical protein
MPKALLVFEMSAERSGAVQQIALVERRRVLETEETVADQSSSRITRSTSTGVTSPPINIFWIGTPDRSCPQFFN